MRGLTKMESDDDNEKMIELAESFHLDEAIGKLRLCADKERAEGFKIMLGDQSIEVPAKKSPR